MLASGDFLLVTIGWRFLENVYPRLEPMVRSVLEDRNGVGTPNESRTDDLNLKIKL